MKRILIVLVLLLLLAGVAWWRVYAPEHAGWRFSPPLGPEQAARCSLCARAIHSGMTAGYGVSGEAEQKKACCAACVLEYGRQSGKRVEVQRVTDYISGEPLAPERAIFVVGSDEHPCSGQPVLMAEPGAPLPAHYDRCLPSVIAFTKVEGAQEFAREHGGSVERWTQILAGAQAPRSAGERKP